LTIQVLCLEQYENVQFYVVGPPGDEAGQYAASRLVSLAKIPLFAYAASVGARTPRPVRTSVPLPALSPIRCSHAPHPTE